MSSGHFRSFSRSVLPEDFERVCRLTGRCQAALQSALPPGIGSMVKVLTVKTGSVTVAANTPVVANYLRLHHSRLQAALAAVTGPTRIDIKTRPESLAEVVLPARPRQPDPVKPETVTRLASSANAIEDESLRHAMQSLAQTLGDASRSRD